MNTGSFAIYFALALAFTGCQQAHVGETKHPHAEAPEKESTPSVVSRLVVVETLDDFEPARAQAEAGPTASRTTKKEAKARYHRGAPNRLERRDSSHRLTTDRTTPGDLNREGYNHLSENGFKRVTETPLSTFSIDVDTASYANVRRILNNGSLPPKDAVRIEEMINYFAYNYEGPTGNEAFAVNTEVGVAPWNEKHRLIRIGLKGRTIPRGERPSSNLVFLLDVSGSMNSPQKLPLLKTAFKVLVNQLDARDTVSIAVYAGASGIVLPPTPGDRKSDILNALDGLQAGGSTNGGAGINLAYKLAMENFVPGGTNRVILATDGDMNVGTTSQGALIRLIQSKAKSGVFLSVLGFGSGNLQDSTMEQIADKGNGNYAYIDSVSEARKVLGTEVGSTLITIAKDVKVQVEFNPAKVAGYRLLGYENRLMANEHFNDDTKDAGELGAGHTVTALYEVVPVGKSVPAANTDALKYQKPLARTDASNTNELMTVKLRYKEPTKSISKLVTHTVAEPEQGHAASQNFRFASAVAAFGMLLRESPNRGSANYMKAIEWATSSLGTDPSGRRMELVVLMKKARQLGDGIGL